MSQQAHPVSQCLHWLSEKSTNIRKTSGRSRIYRTGTVNPTGIITDRKEVWSKAIFSQACVSHSVHGGRGSLYDVTSCLAACLAPVWWTTDDMHSTVMLSCFGNFFLKTVWKWKKNWIKNEFRPSCSLPIRQWKLCTICAYWFVYAPR